MRTERFGKVERAHSSSATGGFNKLPRILVRHFCVKTTVKKPVEDKSQSKRKEMDWDCSKVKMFTLELR